MEKKINGNEVIRCLCITVGKYFISLILPFQNGYLKEMKTQIFLIGGPILKLLD